MYLQLAMPTVSPDESLDALIATSDRGTLDRSDIGKVLTHLKIFVI
jgi:hypothetical protein